MSEIDLVIVGCGAQARYILDAVADNRNYKIAALADIEESGRNDFTVDGFRVMGSIKAVVDEFNCDKIKIIVAYGDNEKKKKAAEFLAVHGFSFAKAVSRGAWLSPSALIGDGSIINPMAVIGANVRIGRHVIVHSGAIVEHDSEIDDYVNIGPGASMAGRVKIKQCSYVYTGACIAPDIKVGARAVVGAGAVVISDVADGRTVAGNPARLLNKRG